MKIPGSFITAAKQVGEKVVKKAGDEFFKKSQPLSTTDKRENAVVGTIIVGAGVTSLMDTNKSSSSSNPKGSYQNYGSSW